MKERREVGEGGKAPRVKGELFILALSFNVACSNHYVCGLVADKRWSC